MGGPSGVGDAYGASAVFIAGGLFQGRDLAFGLVDGNTLAIALVEEDIFKIGMCLPAGPYVSDEDVKYMVDCIKEAII